MAQALFIDPIDIKRHTIMDGDVDDDKIILFIVDAMDIHIQNTLGTDLFDKLKSLIVAGTLNNVGNEDYLYIMDTFIKKMTIYWTMYQMLPSYAFQIKNGGIYRHTSETGDLAEMSEIDRLINRARDTADHYTTRFIDYMCFNSAKFPEYTSNSNGDMYPDKESDFIGWEL